MNILEVVDSRGLPVPLGALIGKGGEGTVFEVRQAPTVVAKVYHKPLTQDRADKIRVMTGMRTEALSKLTSWPSDLLLSKSTRQPVGLLMPRIANRKNVHHLYGPKSRLQDFPRADWRFLVHAAGNIAKAFAAVHEAGCVIGDVNHGSIMVAEDATVRLIDCDSFQISTPTRRFLCEVGIETFTPPELQDRSFKGVHRTPNHDDFGLAVMIFHLLFMGRHPFAGRYSGLGEMPIKRAIKECRFPYGGNHKAMQMERPPGTPPLSFVGAEIAKMFETAFSSTVVSGGRPPARNWASAMEDLEKNTRRCASIPGHWHPAHLSTCPWCHMEAHGAKPLFPIALQGMPRSTLDLAALWHEIQGMKDMGPAPILPAASVSPSPSALKVGKPYLFAKALPILLGAGVFFGGTVLMPPLFWVFGIVGAFVYNYAAELFGERKEVVEMHKVLTEAERNFNELQSDWQRRAADTTTQRAKQNFERIKREIEQVPGRRLRALDQLRQDQKKLQLSRFLDRFELDDARIEGIGPGRKRTLESYGIETADDLLTNRLRAVPGFGPKMIERLLSWRRSVEAKFVFDPTQAIDPRDIAKVEQDILAIRTKLESSARTTHAEAVQAQARLSTLRRTLGPNLAAAQAAAAQARADYEYVKG